MPFFKTKHEKKSARLTAAIMALLLLLLYFLGLPYLDPPLEYGLTVTLGTADTGLGKIQQANVIPDNFTPLQESTTANSMTSELTKPEKVIVQDQFEAVVIKNENQDLSESERLADDQARKSADQRAQILSEQNAKKAKLDELLGSIKDPSKDQSGSGISEGNSKQGKSNGDPYAPAYFGINGLGQGGMGYGLSGRGKPSNSKVKPECDEEGTVVVEIQVNRAGQVIKAVAGKKGTNGDICLYEAAEKTAMTYRWSVDNKAPLVQIGFVIVNFSLKQ